MKDKTLRKKNEAYSFIIHANNNTMKSEIKCAYRVNFTKPHNIWSLLGFFIESRAGVATVRIRRIDKYHQCKYHSYWMQCDHITISPCTWYVNFRQAHHQDIRYRKDRYRSFTFRSSYGALQIWQFVDKNGLLNFRGEITVRLHIRRRQR